MSISIFGVDEIRRAVTVREAVEAVEAAFAALARGEARLPDVINLDIPEAQGEVHVKGAHLQGQPYFVIKVASGFYDNPPRGLPSGSGLMLGFDAATGFPAALLLDNGYLTDLRTGAAGAVAAKYLANPALKKVAVIGAGLQARHQLRALAIVRDIPRVAIWNRTPRHAEQAAAELGAELGVDVTVAPSVEAAVHGADLVVTVTASRDPLVRAEWLAPGVHVTAVGSDGPDKQELDVGVLARADRIFADRLSQCLRLGEIHHAVEAGAIGVEQVAGELGDVIVGRIPGRTDARQITVCDLTGVGVQDAAIAGVVLRKLTSAALPFIP